MLHRPFNETLFINLLTFRSKTLDKHKTKIVGFTLGRDKFYFVAGPSNIQTFFRNSPHIGFERFALFGFKNMVGLVPSDYAKFANDKSGRGHIPLPGTEDTPPEKRYWAKLLVSLPQQT